MDLVQAVYSVSIELPKHELYGLTSQIRRAAVSIPSNIAEGRRRGSRADFRHFLLIAYASGAELETQLELMHRLYPDIKMDYARIDAPIDEVMRMLNTMTARLQATS
ncbi:MAG: four helix bundle protein [Patescibacteria group bacterium]